MKQCNTTIEENQLKWLKNHGYNISATIRMLVAKHIEQQEKVIKEIEKRE